MRIIIAAGGTGGHIYPGIAIAEEFLSRDKRNEVLFIGGYGLEERIIGKEGYKIKKIHVKGIIRKLSLEALLAPFISFIGFIESLSIIYNFNPQAVVLTGGYVSFPVALAAKILGKRTLLHEQNALPGFVNRSLSKIVGAVALSFSESLKYMKGVVTGNPVRRRIILGKREEGGEIKRKKVLVMGGSQGARSINMAILSNLEKFKEKGIEITHIIGDRDYDKLLGFSSLSSYPFYHPIRYMYNIEQALIDCDLVVSRAGATAIAEFLVMELPMVLIPFPYAAENHQDINAETVKEWGAAVVVKDDELSELPDVILELIDNKEKMVKMAEASKKMARPEAAKKMVDLIYGDN